MKLTRYLEIKGLSAAAFAAKVGLHPSAIGRLCAGQRLPRRETMRRIQEATDGKVKPADFFDVPSAASREDAAA